MNDHFPNIDAVNDALRVLVHHHPVLRGAAQPATLASYRAGPWGRWHCDPMADAQLFIRGGEVFARPITREEPQA